MSNMDKIKEVLLFCDSLGPAFLHFKTPHGRFTCYSSGEVNFSIGYGISVFKFLGKWEEQIDKIEPYIDEIYKVHNERFYLN